MSKNARNPGALRAVQRSVPELQRITPLDAEWPTALERVPDPPSGLWLRGDSHQLASEPRVAVVGTRAPTPYGEAQARRFGGALARAGVSVVSGLARGVDSAAHDAALDAGGATLAVLGSGVDVPWPDGPTTRRVAREGLLVSEFAPGTGPRRHHFPLRNRIIAALSCAVLVVEAAERSGSLVTARWALDLGLDVLAIPGRIDHPMARGTLALIRDGATPVGSPEQMLADVFGALGPTLESGPDGAGPAARPTAGLARDVFDALEGETLTAAELGARIGAPLGEVLAAVVGLELDGWVRGAPGGLYLRG